jgi:Fe-S cluster assembly iron-binding protein IscA
MITGVQGCVHGRFAMQNRGTAQAESEGMEVRIVLKVSDAAITAIRELVAEADVPPEGGLRVVSTCENGMLGLMLCVVDAPEPFDHTVEQGGVAVYVDPRALQMAEGQVLDVAPTERGGYRFELR